MRVFHVMEAGCGGVVHHDLLAPTSCQAQPTVNKSAARPKVPFQPRGGVPGKTTTGLSGPGNAVEPGRDRAAGDRGLPTATT